MVSRNPFDSESLQLHLKQEPLHSYQLLFIISPTCWALHTLTLWQAHWEEMTSSA